MIPSSYKPINGRESPPSSTDNTTQPSHKKHKRLLHSIKSIDRGFVVSKCFYFFFYTALGALFPFFSLYYKQLWLSPGQIGILLALRPTVKLVCLPLWRMITDKYSQPKVVYFISIFGWLIGYYGQTFVYISDVSCYGLASNPHASSVNQTWNNATRFNGSLTLKTRDFVVKKQDEFGPKLYQSLNSVEKAFYAKKEMITDAINGNGERAVLIDPKISQIINEQAKSEFDSIEKKNSRNLVNMKASANEGKKKEKILDDSRRYSERFGSDKDRYTKHLLRMEKLTGVNKKKAFKILPADTQGERDFNAKALEKKEIIDKVAKPAVTSSDKAKKTIGPFQHIISKSPKPANDFRVQYNFWIFRTLVIIVILTEIITAPTPMIADSAVIQSIADTDSKYGTQRLFGSLGLALSAILVAIWVSYSSFCPYSDTINYLPCFYIFMVAMGITVFVSLFFKFEKSEERDETTVSFLEGLKIFKTPRYGFFLFTIFVLGFSHSLQISFLFWFLQDIGGTPTLFAIIILIYCISEVVMYFISGYVMEAIGHQGTICLAIACYTARFLMYSSLKDPWLVIPMEIVQGVTYGGVWTVTGVYIKAPEGATKTIQSILHGTYWGVGMATGALVSGLVIDAYGAQSEFLVMCLVLFILGIVHVFLFIKDRVEDIEKEANQRRASGFPDPNKKKEPAKFIGAAAAPLVPCLLYGR